MDISDKVFKATKLKGKRKIIAIGGGEIIRDGVMGETEAIDREIIRLSGKLIPKLLFIPTASHDSAGYCNNILAYYGTELGCDVSFLLLYSETDPVVIRDKILSADIIYVGGGSTYAMMRRWKALGVDEILVRAAENGTVMSGLSAGSICWFRHGCSNSWKAKNPDAPMIRVSGLGWVNAMMCPHYNTEDYRKGLIKLIKRTSGKAIAIDDCCAIEFIGSEFRIISSKDTANAYLVYWKNGTYHEEIIPKTKEFSHLSNLGV